MAASGNTPRQSNPTFTLFLDSVGSLAHEPDVHVLYCGDPTHVENVLTSASVTSSSELCPTCEKSMHFAGKPKMCPLCQGSDTQCRICQGEGAKECVYIVSIPRRRERDATSMTRAEFQDDINRIWGEMLANFDALIGSIRNLLLYIIDRTAFQSEEQEILARMAARACQTADAINCLLNSGHPDAAFALSRIIQEIKYNMMVIHKDTSPDTAEKYREWSLGKMFRSVRALHDLGIRELSDSEYEEMELAYQSACNKYGDDFKRDDGWIGKNVFERAKSVDQESDYRKFYSAASSFVHTDARSLLLPIGLSDRNKGRILVGPSGIGFDLAATQTAMSLIHIAMYLPEMLEFEEDVQTAAAIDALRDSMGQMISTIELIDPKNLYAPGLSKS